MADQLPQRRIRLRTGLMLLVLATALPLIAFALLASALVVGHQQDAYVSAVKDRNRAFMSAVDHELRSTIVALYALSAARSLARDDFAEFYESARALLAAQPFWRNVILLDASGRQLVNTAVPWGTRLPARPDDRGSWQEFMAGPRPLVGDVVVEGPILERPGIPVRVPVTREGKLTYVLTAVLKPEAFQPLFEAQRLPQGWVSGLADAKGRLIARVPPKPVGSMASEHYLAASRAAREGWYRGKTLEGLDTFTAHVTSDVSGWSLGLAIPSELVLGATRRAAWLMGGGIVLSIALAFGLALWLGGRIAGPIGTLSAAAHDLGRRATRIAVHTPIHEVDELAVSLNDASQEIRSRDAELRASEERSRERAEALTRADRNKSEFLAMLSHELRNPLAPLSYGLALLKTRGQKALGGQVLEMMERQVRQLGRLIDDLLDISRIDRGKLELHRERIAADGIVRSAVEISRPNFESRRHELVLRFPGTPVYLDADPVRIGQVLSNVLNNAAKFTPEGGRIDVTLAAEGGEALITVADNGIGLAPGDAAKIFDMFVQLDSSRSQSAGGLGLGLTLARNIVERHGGRISAESEGEGRGTRFTIRLPAAPAPQAQPQLRPVRSPAEGRRRVLVVDDNVDAATSLVTMLELAGHEARAVFSGAEALAAAEAFRPDVVVLDLNLPGLDGVEICRRLRASSWARGIAIVALTGMGQPADLARTAQAGFDLHLTKPVGPERVLELIAGGGKPE